MKRFLKSVITVALVVLVPAGAFAQEGKAKSLDELLKEVKTRNWRQKKEMQEREARFIKEKNTQAQTLQRAKAQLARLERQSDELERTFQENEREITELEAQLKERIGTMGELFGVVRQSAGDARAQMAESLVSAQVADRDAALAELAQSKGLPSISQLENLWIAMQTEMTEQGTVARFKASIVSNDGTEEQREVVRVGVFNAVSNGKYLQWKAGKLVERVEQPPGRHLAGARKLQTADSGFVRFSVDPSRGKILDLLVATPSFFERLQFGGIIGYIIIALGLLAMVLAIWRLTMLTATRRKVQAQERAKAPKADNPLGRILQVGDQNQHADPETLELKLDEAILKEESGLEKYLWAIKVVSVAAPLMGLLGTVTGMITTFQTIMLYGAGDPKLMAGGISQALVTTMLGLTVAIPLVLIYSWVSTMSKSIVEVLEERSAGIVALRAERASDAAAA